jgi:hypothetical protein
MSRITLPQRAFWIAVVTAAAPYAFFRLALKPIIAFDGDVLLDEDDVYDNLRDGEVAAEID